MPRLQYLFLPMLLSLVFLCTQFIDLEMARSYDAILLTEMQPLLNERRAACAPELDPAAHAPEVYYNKVR